MAASTPPHGGQPTNVMRNIMVSVTSTVLGATIIYFLGFHSKGKSGNSFLEKKEATTSAWKSYAAYDNAYYRNIQSYEKEFARTGFDPYLAGVLKESEKFQEDLTQLMKTKGIDNDLVTAMGRRLENKKSLHPKLKEYFDNIKKIFSDTSSAVEVRQAAHLAEETRWVNYNKGVFERVVNELQEIAKILTERYGQPFSMNDFLVIQQFDQRMKSTDSLLEVLRKNYAQDDPIDTSHIVRPRDWEYAKNFTPKDIIGKWNMGTGTLISIMQNGQVSWIIDEDNRVDGTWKIENNILIMDVVSKKGNNKLLWQFRIAKLKRDSFTLVPDGENMLPYDLVRIPG